jgi:hypothetical protein
MSRVETVGVVKANPQKRREKEKKKKEEAKR